MEKIKSLFIAVWPVTAALFLGLAGMRVYEFLNMEANAQDSFLYCLQGMLVDLMVALFVTAIYVLIQSILFLFKVRILLGIMHVLAILALLVNFILVQYFLSTKLPLDEAIYFFSVRELKLIIGSENRMTFSIAAMLVAVFAAYFLLVRVLKKVKTGTWFFRIFALLVIISLAVPSLTYYESESNHRKSVVVNNRLAYFAHRTAFYFTQDRSGGGEVKLAEFAGLDANFYGGKSISKEYPLMHEMPEYSEFSEFLNKSEKGPPNIVFVIVESLSTTLVGEKGKKTGNLLPFLDSLSEQSLYWPNFLSTCDRTHNVLPAALASVPYTTKGNLFQQLEFPNHWSLISLLRKEYFTRFYCGVDLNFSNMNGYMNYYQTQYIVKDWERQFNVKFSERPTPWGYPDGMLFDKSWLDYKKQQLDQKKRLDVFLTISTHDPYVIPREKYYTDLVHQRIDKIRHPTETHQYVKDNAFRFATFVYLDDALRKYFDKARKHKDFDNTIFLIFGDHGTEFCLYDEMSRYKIPLIIYSPLIKKPQVFRSVSSQLDLAPTLLNYLRITYGMKLPSTTSFIGKGLSYGKKFSSDRSLVLGTSGLKDEHVVHKNHFMFHGILFRIKDELEIELDDDKKKRKEVSAQRRMCNLMADYTIYGNKIMPVNILKSYTDVEEFKELYSYSEARPGKDVLSNMSMSIGENVVLPKDVKYVRIQFDCDYWNVNLERPTELPKLTFSLEHEVKGKNELLVWKQIGYHQVKDFKKNAWNHLSATLTIRMSDYKKMSEKNLLKYYLLNEKEGYFKMKNIKTTVLRDL